MIVLVIIAENLFRIVNEDSLINIHHMTTNSYKMIKRKARINREIIFYVYTKLRTYLRTQWTKFGETSSKTLSKTLAA